MGIGGEHVAINSAIDEMLPSRFRGRVDIGVKGRRTPHRRGVSGRASA
jgi:hypothetical protein